MTSKEINMKYIDDEKKFKMESDDNGFYFYCVNCGKKVYEGDVEKTNKYWDDDSGNHLMIYTCPHCNYDNYEK